MRKMALSLQSIPIGPEPNDPGRPSIRRSPEYKAKLSAASDLLAAKMEEKRLAWEIK